MRYILNVKNFTLEKIDEIELTKDEVRLLSLLSSNDYVSYDELYEYNFTNRTNIQVAISRLRKKFPEIDVQYIEKEKTRGLRLKNEIKIDY